MTNQVKKAQAVEIFWESVPPAWIQTRNQIRRIAFSKFHLTEEQFQILRRIRKGSTSVSTLAVAGQTSRSAVRKAVDALVRRGLVTRSQDPSDRRNIPLALTNEGRRAMDGIFTEAEAWLSTHFESISQEELETLLLGMKILLKAFSNP